MTDRPLTDRQAAQQRAELREAQRAQKRAPSRRMQMRRQLAKRVGLSSIGGFAAILVVLAGQLAAGNDPALSQKPQQIAAVAPVRKIIKTTIIVKRRVAPVAAAPSTGTGSSVALAPVQSSSPSQAPVAAAPAPAPAPVTRTS